MVIVYCTGGAVGVDIPPQVSIDECTILFNTYIYIEREEAQDGLLCLVCGFQTCSLHDNASAPFLGLMMSGWLAV